MTPLWPIRVHVHPALVIGVILALAWIVLRRDRRVWTPIYAEPEDGVQPWDPRTVTLTSSSAPWQVDWRGWHAGDARN